MSDENPRVKARNWCFTLNNPTDEEREYFRNFQPGDFFNYMIYQEEKAPSTGTIHFQGYIECREQRERAWMKIHFNSRARLAPRFGTQLEAINYCRKEESRVEGGQSGEFGTPKQMKGCTAEEKAKAVECLEKLRKGEIRSKDIDTETYMIPGFVAAKKQCLSDMGNGPDRADSFRIFVVNGPTGVGKSYAFHKICRGDYTTWRDGWFVNAENLNKYLFLDEFIGGCKNGMQLHDLLNALDPFPSKLPIKGSHAPAVYTDVFITTNISPTEWYSAIGPNGEEIKKRKENLNALYDRIGFYPPNPDPNYERVRTTGHYLDLWEDDPENPRFLGGRVHESIREKRDRLKRWLESFGFSL